MARVEEVACQTLEQRPIQIEHGQEIFSIHSSMLGRCSDRRPQHVTANALTALLHRETDAEGIDLTGFVDVGPRHRGRSGLPRRIALARPSHPTTLSELRTDFQDQHAWNLLLTRAFGGNGERFPRQRFDADY
ncbi:hypothetical protein M8523_18715 [Hyphomicrobiales bacterium BP6-180914]|uniref:Uncharacterized protein n=1 Tax=Lichenifustis flavocetrariae TaxID=2949735 RepID=A0AA41YWV0_9HYPH|nr:hypothetical protein [Lichenifustis flavocetrariae]MCW6510056.1 hypothetical protein [Lichenifustis flavocetrariae]